MQLYNEVTTKQFCGGLCLSCLTDPVTNLLRLAYFMNNILIYLLTTVLQTASRPCKSNQAELYPPYAFSELKKDCPKEKKNHVQNSTQPLKSQSSINGDGKQCLHCFTGLFLLHVYFRLDLAFEISKEKNFHLLLVLLNIQECIFCGQWLLSILLFNITKIS